MRAARIVVATVFVVALVEILAVDISAHTQAHCKAAAFLVREDSSAARAEYLSASRCKSVKEPVLCTDKIMAEPVSTGLSIVRSVTALMVAATP